MHGKLTEQVLEATLAHDDAKRLGPGHRGFEHATYDELRDRMDVAAAIGTQEEVEIGLHEVAGGIDAAGLRRAQVQ